jgi:hypothetical protein
MGDGGCGWVMKECGVKCIVHQYASRIDRSQLSLVWLSRASLAHSQSLFEFADFLAAKLEESLV